MLRLAAALLCISLFAAPVSADEVILVDGTRILGGVVDLVAGSLTIEGGAAGKVSVPFSSVKNLATDEDHIIVFSDGATARGRFATSANGAHELITAEGARSIDYGLITHINPPEVDPVQYSGNIALSAKSTYGNTNTESIAANGEFIRRSEKDRLTFFAAWNYSEENKTVSERNALGRGKYDYFFNDRLFAYGNGSLEGDEFANLDLRSTLGAGAGYQFFDTDVVQYYEEAGLSYFDEDFDGGENNQHGSSRLSGKLDWVLVTDRVTLFHFHELFWSLEDERDVLVDTRTGLRFTLLANFFASFQLNVKWNNSPSAGSERTDTEYLLGLGYAYTF